MQINILTRAMRARLSVKLIMALLTQGVELNDLITLSEAQLARLGFSEKQAVSFLQDDEGEQELHWLENDKHSLISIFDAAYPALLKEIADPPLGLYVMGDISLLSQPQLAMVGSRNPSHAGKQIAEEFAAFFAEAGLCITSGMATGIDAASHRGALHKIGKTIAVCGTGLDRVYPAQHRGLAQQIAEYGALVSEFPLGTKPQAYNFPQRNRIISGLSLGTLVVEAAVQSGSLITARQALDQGREVFAVPGSIHNPLAKGCHQLIRQGAKLVETAQDVLEELRPFFQAALCKDESAVEITETDPILDSEYQQLLEAVGYETTAVDVIVARTGLPASQVASRLLILELNSHIVASAGGYQRLK
jgi:DNA processing protein